MKPPRRPQTANTQPASFIGGTNLSNRRMRTRMYGGVAGEERRLPPYADLLLFLRWTLLDARARNWRLPRRLLLLKH